VNEDADLAYFKAQHVRESPKAVLVRLEKNGKEFWVPKSLMAWHREGILTVEQWFATKEKMD
jgi:hypothetical protein